MKLDVSICYLRGNNRIYYGVLIKYDSEGELIFILDEYSSDHFYCFFSLWVQFAGNFSENVLMNSSTHSYNNFFKR